jgi:hypothetical protein
MYWAIIDLHCSKASIAPSCLHTQLEKHGMNNGTGCVFIFVKTAVFQIVDLRVLCNSELKFIASLFGVTYALLIYQ